MGLEPTTRGLKERSSTHSLASPGSVTSADAPTRALVHPSRRYFASRLMSRGSDIRLAPPISASCGLGAAAGHPLPQGLMKASRPFLSVPTDSVDKHEQARAAGLASLRPAQGGCRRAGTPALRLALPRTPTPRTPPAVCAELAHLPKPQSRSPATGARCLKLRRGASHAVSDGRRRHRPVSTAPSARSRQRGSSEDELNCVCLAVTRKLHRDRRPGWVGERDLLQLVGGGDGSSVEGGDDVAVAEPCSGSCTAGGD